MEKLIKLLSLLESKTNDRQAFWRIINNEYSISLEENLSLKIELINDGYDDRNNYYILSFINNNVVGYTVDTKSKYNMELHIAINSLISQVDISNYRLGELLNDVISSLSEPETKIGDPDYYRKSNIKNDSPPKNYWGKDSLTNNSDYNEDDDDLPF